jgi:ATP-dependent RNA helicase DeaD
VGTPGRILDLLRQKVLQLNRCRYFALDEADEMLSMGFIEDIRTILSRLPDRRQGMFVSATITGRVEMLARSFLTKPGLILIGDFNTDIPDIEHLYCEVGGELMAKPQALCDLIETMRPRSAIIFCNTKSDTNLVEALLRRRGFDARRINSDLNQNKRDRIMNQIRAEELQFLVATDIAARGLDIEQIDLVVNYSIHDQTETYIHRTGRTGRAGRSGKAVSLIGPRDHGAFHFLKKVVDFDFRKLPLPNEDEVADARLTHMYELIRLRSIELSERDVLVAKKLVRELGAIAEPTDELSEMVAKLCRFSVEHFIAAEAKALDEELDAPDDAAAGSGRGKKQGRERDEERGNRDRGRDRKRKSRDADAVDENDKTENQRARSTHSDDADAGTRSERKSEDLPPEEIRVYIGQGLAEGLTKEVFHDLVEKHSGLSNADLRKLTIREHYGFVDLFQPSATQLIEKLNGAGFQDSSLSIELASSLSDGRRRNNRNNRGGGGGRSGSGRGGRSRGRSSSRGSAGSNRDSRSRNS